MIKTSWPISNLESHPDTVGGAGYRLYETNRTYAMYVPNAHHQIPAGANEHNKTAVPRRRTSNYWIYKTTTPAIILELYNSCCCVEVRYIDTLLLDF